MYNGHILSQLVQYTTEEYPDYDIRKSKRKFRRRVYEQMIINDILEYCIDKPFSNLIDILEEFELFYLYGRSKLKSDIYTIQLDVIRKLLLFLRKME